MKKNQVTINEFNIKSFEVKIKGISPLIVHNFDQKITLEMEAKQQGKAKTEKHKIRVPEDDFEGAKHKSPLGFEGFPAGGFKKAFIRGAKMTGLVMKDAQMAFFVKADCEETQLVKINGDCRMRTDMVRVGMGSADIRYRPEYLNWNATIKVEFNEGLISVEQILQCVKAAGYGCGIGDWRPEKGGGYGRFELDV
jgi:hypothetical protein